MKKVRRIPKKLPAKTGKFHRLAEDVIDILKAEQARTGRSETRVLEDKVRGIDRFSARAEEWIESAMRATGKTRDQVIEDAIIELSLRSGNHKPKS